MKVGILGLQGDIAEHRAILEKIGQTAVLVKRVQELEECQGLILPGGESTTQRKLLALSGLDEAVQARVAKGELGVLGTCAGAILLAKQVVGDRLSSLGLMDIEIKRNAFGRQKESFEENVEGEGFPKPFRGVFIRAPLITQLGTQVENLIHWNGGSVLARQGKCLACCFHPELAHEERIHQMFVTLLQESPPLT